MIAAPAEEVPSQGFGGPGGGVAEEGRDGAEEIRRAAEHSLD